jgi:hypothetical protein
MEGLQRSGGALAERQGYFGEIEKGLLGLGQERAGLVAPDELDAFGVESLIFEKELPAVAFGKAALNELEVEAFVESVELVANNRVANRLEMDPNLMFAPGTGFDTKQGELTLRLYEMFEECEPCFGVCAIGPNAIFNGHRAFFITTQGGVNGVESWIDMAVNNGEVAFQDFAAFPNAAEFEGSHGVFGDQNDAAGFAIEAVDEFGAGVRAEVEAHTADQAGIDVAFGRMTNEAGWFVDDQQVGTFVNGLKQLRHQDESGQFRVGTAKSEVGVITVGKFSNRS